MSLVFAACCSSALWRPLVLACSRPCRLRVCRRRSLSRRLPLRWSTVPASLLVLGGSAVGGRLSNCEREPTTTSDLSQTTPTTCGTHQSPTPTPAVAMPITGDFEKNAQEFRRTATGQSQSPQQCQGEQWPGQAAHQLLVPALVCVCVWSVPPRCLRAPSVREESARVDRGGPHE